MDRKREISLYPAYKESHFEYKDTNKLKTKGEKWYVNINQKKPGVAILVSDKVDFRDKNINRD